MKRLDLRGVAEKDALEMAVAVLEAGGVVAYPTETFYALGARYDSEKALERVFRLKGRRPDKAISLIIGETDDAEPMVKMLSPLARGIMEAHWPGPVTIVLPAADGLSDKLTQCMTIALRVPGDSFALRLVRAAGFAITATSANPAASPPASDADEVEDYFGDGIDLLVDGGPAPGGLPSTIVDVTTGKARVLRAGAVKVRQDR